MYVEAAFRVIAIGQLLSKLKKLAGSLLGSCGNFSPPPLLFPFPLLPPPPLLLGLPLQ